MPIPSNDEVLNENGTTNETGAETQQQNPVLESNDTNLDKQLEDLISATDRDTKTTTDTKQTPTTDAAKSPIPQQDAKSQQANQEQQPRPNEQSPTQTQQPQPIPEAARKFGDLFYSDRRGNVFTANGELIAPSGNPHKLFRKMYGYIEQAQNETAGLKARLDAYDNANAAAKAAGLNAEEYAAGISLITAYKKDPKVAINFMLQQAQARGIDLGEIVPNAGGVTEASLRNAVAEVLNNVIQEKFGYVFEERQKQQQEVELQQQANQEYEGFIQTYPDARIHGAAIADVMEASGKSMTESYLMLQNWTLRNGLDWTKPLAPQVEAKRQQNAEPNGGGNNHRLPDLNGRNNNGGVVHDRRLASADESWDSIIKSTVSEIAGRAN